MTLRTVSPHASREVRPAGGEEPQHLGRLLERDEVELHVLAGGEVAPAARVGLADEGQHLELLGRDLSRRGS